ncbi:acyl-CoA binding domain-containing protein 6 [Thoreauomyces humboldtii]|nr:acyl-CoA binding domain-containing protein 6 [Thoreauomyces humboldtii]
MSSAENIALAEDFAGASAFLSSPLEVKLPNEVLLEIYALYKVATVGKCDAPRPGYFEFTAKAKWDAWTAESETSREEAMRRYVEIARNEAGWTPGAVNANTASEPTFKGEASDHQVGVTVSTLANPRQSIEESQKTVWNWVEEGRVDKVMQLLDSKATRIDVTDDHGMSLLHWAADRGHADLTRKLLERGSDVNARDNEGQTALHLGVVVENEDIVRTLVAAGADLTLKDELGDSPEDCASPEMSAVIKEAAAVRVA